MLNSPVRVLIYINKCITEEVATLLILATVIRSLKWSHAQHALFSRCLDFLRKPQWCESTSTEMDIDTKSN